MLSYSSDDILKALEPVFEDHAEWYGLVMRRIFFAHEYAPEQGVQTPNAFPEWLVMVRTANALDHYVLEQLELLHNELHAAADLLISRKIAANEMPDVKSFDNLGTLYDQFILQLRRLERDYTLAQNGIDYLTGLRNAKAIEVDYERELERLARRGQNFCLVLGSLDFFDELKKVRGLDGANEVIRAAAAYIKRALRSFDDAYRQNECEFIMLLKQTDTIGGAAAIERLRRFFQDTPLFIDPKNEDSRITMSFCAAAPTPGDPLRELLTNMRMDLKRFNEGGDTALEYYEQSPLQRFLQDNNDKQA